MRGDAPESSVEVGEVVQANTSTILELLTGEDAPLLREHFRQSSVTSLHRVNKERGWFENLIVTVVIRLRYLK